MRGNWAFIAALLPTAWCQQPAGTRMFTNYTGLTDGCKEALATNVTCPPFLPVVAPNNAILDEDQVSDLCIEDCYQSLQSARAIIQTACTKDDEIVFDNIAYPATYIVDNYILTYNISCFTDAEGNFCDPLFFSWANGTAWPPLNSSCSSCWLGVLALQLNNPLGYDEGLEESFSSLTSSCNATGYSVTSPTAYALNATVTATSASTTTTATTSITNCIGIYEVNTGDDCNSVAKALGVSTYYLLMANDLDLYCHSFDLMVNQTLCIPSQCTTYTWAADDTCDSVVGSLGNVTLTQFFSWNPNFNSLCLNAPFFIGYEVCLSPPGGYLNHTGSGDDGSTTTLAATGIAAVPTNALSGSNVDCGLWYTIEEGDDCAIVSSAQSISLAEFYFLNPEIDSDCTNLELGEAYCVKPVGSITSYPNYTVTGLLPVTATPATFASVDTSIPTSTAQSGYIYTETALLPTASGTISDCYLYENADNETTTCLELASDYDIDIDELIEWNPSLNESSAANCTLSLSNSYCVMKYENSTSYTSTEAKVCLPVEATEAGTISDCSCFTTIDSYFAPDYTCDDLISDNHITMAELLAWNSWLSVDCDTALYANLGDYDDRSVCIGVSSTAVITATTTVPITAVLTVVTPSSSTIPLPITSTLTSTLPSISDLPTCGQTCFNNMLAEYDSLGCSSADPSCLCQNINFYYGIRDCSNGACGTDVASTVIAYESAYCASATATLTLTTTTTLPPISDLPTCGQTCFNNMLAEYDSLGCSSADPSCLCQNINFYYGIRDCSNGACGTDVASTVIAYESAYCASATATLTLTTTTTLPPISDLPTCGQTCFNNMLAEYDSLGCSSADPSCLCQNINFYYGIRDCSNGACGTDVASTVIAYESAYCASATASA